MILKQVSADGAAVLGGFFFFSPFFATLVITNMEEKCNVVKYYGVGFFFRYNVVA